MSTALPFHDSSDPLQGLVREAEQLGEALLLRRPQSLAEIVVVYTAVVGGVRAAVPLLAPRLPNPLHRERLSAVEVAAERTPREVAALRAALPRTRLPSALATVECAARWSEGLAAVLAANSVAVAIGALAFGVGGPLRVLARATGLMAPAGAEVLQVLRDGDCAPFGELAAVAGQLVRGPGLAAELRAGLHQGIGLWRRQLARSNAARASARGVA